MQAVSLADFSPLDSHHFESDPERIPEMPMNGIPLTALPGSKPSFVAKEMFSMALACEDVVVFSTPAKEVSP